MTAREKKCAVFSLDGSNEGRVAGSIAEVLKDGGICVIPTDTLYGLVALDGCDRAVARLHEIKKRPPGKPFIRLIGRIDTFSEYSRQKIPPVLRQYWPGPLTLVVKGKVETTVALRYASSPWLDSLFAALGYGAILAPSANRSGEKEIVNNSDLVAAFQSSVDAIVCRRGGPAGRVPSTILDITAHPFRVIREGALVIPSRNLR